MDLELCCKLKMIENLQIYRWTAAELPPHDAPGQPERRKLNYVTKYFQISISIIYGDFVQKKKKKKKEFYC